MRTYVTFRYPAEFVPLSDEDGILAVGSVQWFATLLSRVSGLEIDPEPCQEDWGVVYFARRNQKKFWIGLSAWGSPAAWLTHFHHGSFAWLQRLSWSGKIELQRLLVDVHEVMAGESVISDIVWHEESEMSKPEPAGFPTPVEG